MFTGSNRSIICSSQRQNIQVSMVDCVYMVCLYNRGLYDHLKEMEGRPKCADME